MKNTPQFLLALIGLLILLVGCGSIDSVPLPDNSPDDATTNAGADPTDEAGEATGAEDGDSSLDGAELENFVVSLDSDRILLPSRSLGPEQRFELYATSNGATIPGEISPEGAANAPLTELNDGVIENRVDGVALSTWVLDSSWQANSRSEEAVRDLRTLAEDPFKEDGLFTWSQCGESSCLTVSDGDPNDDALVVGVFSQALERGVVKTIVNELFQIPLPPNSSLSWKVVVGSTEQSPFVSEFITLSPPLWE
ncbi:MAG: hypothetical protein VX210_05060 [Myxococcota bacterium]|nr:hypothetical protein [Myxococcota bacterium]